MDIDGKYIADQHEFSSGLYAESARRALEVEELFKAEFDVPHDAADREHAGSPRIEKPALARAILDKFISLLAVRADHSFQVVPGSLDDDELEACSKIERSLRGYRLAYLLETKRDPWRRGAWWFFARGRACWEVRVDTSQLGRDKQLVRVYADDPLGIFPVWDQNGVEWYTKATTRYARSVKAEIERRSKGAKKYRWQTPADLAEADANDEVEIVEFWDETHCGAAIGDEVLYVREHKYGCVPLAEARCMETPLADMEWAFQSVLEPIMSSLKGQYALAAKLATGTDLFYWPMILVQSPSGSAVVLNSGTPGIEAMIPPDARVTVLNPTPNQAVLAQLMGWYKSDVQLGGIPDIAWGAEPSNLQSGFAVSQVLGQVMDKVAPHQQALELGLGWQWGLVLKLWEKFGALKGAFTRVPVEREYAQKDGARRTYPGGY